MAQPTVAAGREELPSPAEETFNKMAERLLNEEAEPGVEDDEEEESAAPAEGDGSEEEAAIIEAEDAPADPAAAETDIEPPVSLKAEDKEFFKTLPKEAKEFTARRIAEAERGFHAKAQEAAAARETAQLEAQRWAQGIYQEAAAKLSQFAEQLKPRVPDARLARTDPAAYAHMLSEYHEKSAQREQAQREADMAAQQAQAYQADLEQREFQTQHLRMQAEMPELFDPVTGQEQRNHLLATAQILGIDPSNIKSVDAVKAMKVTSEWRTKAEKYDRAMSKRNERVTRKPTPTAKPGPAQGTAMSSKGRQTDAAWNLVKKSKAGADRDAATAIWLEKAGFL